MHVFQENDRLSHKAQSSTSKLNELKDLTESMREENEKLASSWKQLAEVSFSSQVGKNKKKKLTILM